MSNETANETSTAEQRTQRLTCLSEAQRLMGGGGMSVLPATTLAVLKRADAFYQWVSAGTLPAEPVNSNGE